MLLLLSLPAPGGVLISFPLDGHYRPGRYMPVRVAGNETHAVTIRAEGTVPSEFVPAANAEAIVPWLMVTSSVRHSSWASAGSRQTPIELPLHALGDDERLVGLAGEDAAIAGTLFPDKKIIPVSLELSQPLPGPAMAWEALDAVLLSESAFSRLDQRQWQTLVAAGTALVVRSPRPPDVRWPWKQIGADWVLWLRPAGPEGVIEPDAFIPTYGWQRGWPAPFRRHAIIAGAIFCILATGIALWRSRWAVVAFLVFCAVAAAGVAWWYGRQPPVLQLTGGVEVVDGPVVQQDLWTWTSPVRLVEATSHLALLTHPAFTSSAQIEMTGIRLVCPAGEQGYRFDYRLDRGQSLAFVSRSIQMQSVARHLSPASGPMKDLAEALYVRPPDRILGQYVSGTTTAPIVVVRRKLARD